MERFRAFDVPTSVGRLAVREAGDGPAVVFLHGIFTESLNWSATAPALVARHRAVLVDLPGHGGSAAPVGPVSIERMADGIVEVLDRLGIDSAAFVGLSLGGMVAQQLAIRHPARVKGLVLLGTTSGGPPLDVKLRFVAMASAIALFGMTKPIRDSLADLVLPVPFRRANPELMAGLAARYAAWDARKTWGVFLGLATLQDTAPKLPTIAAPTLVLVGALDQVAPRPYAEAIANAIPGARLEVFDDVGHVIPLEAPQALIGHLESFLAALG